MREIEFRAFNYDTMSWIDIRELGANGLWVCSENEKFWLGFDSVVLEQYTGLKDVNGKKIYEGYWVQKVLISKMPDGSTRTVKLGKPFEVKAGNYAYGKWIAESISGEGFEVRNYILPDETMVLGNIHENPELLEVE